MNVGEPALWRTRACALIEREDHVLLARDGDDPFFALPGGSVEEGEFSDTALRRELAEELGWASEIGSLRLVCENLFRWRGRRYQEIVLLFEARLPEVALPLREGEFAAREPHLSLLWAPRGVLGTLDIRPEPVRALLAGEAGPGIAHSRLVDADF